MILAVALVAGAVVGAIVGFSLSVRRKPYVPPPLQTRTVPETARDGSEATAELRRALATAQEALGAQRAVLWDVDLEREAAHAAMTTAGEHPVDVALAADPLRWAWEQGVTLRLETQQRWSRGPAACVVALRRQGARAALLTLDYASASAFPAHAALEQWGGYVRAHARALLADRTAAEEGRRYRQVLEALRGMPAEFELDGFVRRLAEAARELAGGTGAVVALWSDGVGEVMAVAGDEGGPAPHTRFRSTESVLGIALQTAAPVVRLRRRDETPRVLPIVSVGERWAVEPRAAAAFPLVAPEGGAVAAVAVWSTARAEIPQAELDAAAAIIPYAALQLRHVQAFGELREDSRRDALTGLYNRRSLEERLAAEAARCGRYGRPLSLLILDIDHFKSINDTYGHDAGDEVLRTLGRTLAAATRDADVPARLGGEEFVMILPETDVEAATELAERLRQRIERIEVSWEGKRIPVTASIGVSATPECVSAPSALLPSADAVLYQSKRGGRNRVTAARVVRSR